MSQSTCFEMKSKVTVNIHLLQFIPYTPPGNKNLLIFQVYITWLMTVTADIPFGAMVKYERELASIIVGTYYALVSVVCINLYIALMSETFTRVYENAEANASLQQALLIIFLERLMGPQESAETRKYFKRKCSPLVSES